MRNLGFAHTVSSEVQHELDSGWEMACVPAATAADGGGVVTPEALTRAAVSWLPAQVPGTAASARRAAGHDVFRERHAFDAHDYWFRCRFHGPARAATSRVELRCEGLATLAELWLNGERVLESSSMFLPASCDVTERLQADNELYIRFRALDTHLAVKRPRPRWRTRLTDHQQLRFVRTSLLGRMPGWSPPVHAVGPFRPVRLYVRNAVDVCDVDLRAAVSNLAARVGQVSVRLALDTWPTAVSSAEFWVGETRAALGCSTSLDGQTIVSGELTLADVALWWPHTHGAQALYPVHVRVQLDTPDATEHVIALGNVGFRTLTLDSADGNFALQINGVPIFARGACWMTPDVVALPGHAVAYEAALLSARAAGMNMLRISGTTSYESDAFYRRCDELGILVWQDFMFANMDYPSDDVDFTRSVTSEARAFLQCTQARACLTVLCGGSEVEQQVAMLGLPRELWQGRLFYEVLPAVVAELRPDVPYWPSSPSGGALPFSPSSGVTHYYGVGAYLRPAFDARRAEVKFAAECLAFSNVPDEVTFRHFLADGQMPAHHPAWKERVSRDQGASWDFEDVREHYLRELFQVDPSTLRYTDLERYLALSRVVTGELMASTLTEWRRARSTCTGALVWFYRDLWPGAGLGLLDSTGRPKAAYYYVKRALGPECVFFSDEGLSGLSVHAINERARPLQAELQLTIHHDAQRSVVVTHSEPLDLPAHGQVELQLAALLPWFLDTTHAYRFGPPSHDLVVAQLVERATGRLLSDAFFFPQGLPQAEAQDLGLTCEFTNAPDGGLQLLLRSQRFAQSVFIDVPGYLPEDNYLHLAPNAARQIRLQASADAGPEARGRVHALNSRQVAKIDPPTRPSS